MNNYDADSKLINWCRNIQEDASLLCSIKDSFKDLKPDSELKMLIGSVVAGMSEIMDSQIAGYILHNRDRNILGIETDIYGLYYAASWATEPRPRFIALKSVCDLANYYEADIYYPYAAYTSAKIFEILAKRYLEYDD